MQLFQDITGKGTYATRERAVNKMEDFNAQCEVQFRYIIMATVDGRFAPVAIPNRDQQHYTMTLATAGICVTF